MAHPFQANKAAESQFARALRKIARVSGHLIETHVQGIVISAQMMGELNKYSELLGPWARSQAARMLEQVEKSNKRAYSNKAKAIQSGIKLQVRESELGMAANALMIEQVGLIKSIPLEAALRVQKLSQEAVYGGSRFDEIKNEILRTTEVTESRATTIARTETARATSVINEVRATSVGSRQYKWHNSGDAAVRESHRFYKGKRLQGMIFSWDSPPTLDDGMTGHPGTFPNCRCFAEPIFPDE